MILIAIYIISVLVMSYAIYREWYQGYDFDLKDILIVISLTFIPAVNTLFGFIWLGFSLEDYIDRSDILIKGRDQNA